MTGDKVSIKKPFNIKRFLLIIIAIALIILVLLCAMFLGFFIGKNAIYNYTNPAESFLLKYNEDKIIQEIVNSFNESYINYLLFSLGAGNLHRSTINLEEPIIMVIVDNENYSSEIVDNRILTKKGNTEFYDMVVKTSKEEIARALISENKKDFLFSSISSNQIIIEVRASKLMLASKGYLEMYKEFE